MTVCGVVVAERWTLWALACLRTLLMASCMIRSTTLARSSSISSFGIVEGPDGRVYANFGRGTLVLRKQPDGSWRINGCVLVEDTGESI